MGRSSRPSLRDVGVQGGPSVRIAGMPGCRMSGLPGCRDVGCPGCQDAGMSGVRGAGCPGCQDAGRDKLVRTNPNLSEVIRGCRKVSESIEGNQRVSEGIREDRRQSESELSGYRVYGLSGCRLGFAECNHVGNGHDSHIKRQGEDGAETNGYAERHPESCMGNNHRYNP